MLREALIYSHIAATAAWRDEMQGVTRSQGLFSLTSGTTRQFARQAPSHTGCGQIGRSLASTAWHRSPGYDLRRTRRDLPDLTCNAVHGGINQRFLSVSTTLHRKLSQHFRMRFRNTKQCLCCAARHNTSLLPSLQGSHRYPHQ